VARRLSALKRKGHKYPGLPPDHCLAGDVVFASPVRSGTFSFLGGTCQAQGHPTTHYTAPLRPLPDFTSKAERERMSGPALNTFFYIIERWQVRDEDARELLGGVSNGPYHQMKKNQEGRILSPDELFTISYLIGIFKALNRLHGQSLAERWVRLPNSSRIFNGLAPLEYMKKRRPVCDGNRQRTPRGPDPGNITDLAGDVFPDTEIALNFLRVPPAN